MSGMRSEAQKILDRLRELSKYRYVNSYCVAIIYIGLGDKDQAFVWLNKAAEERGDRIAKLKVDPIFDSLRPDQRFADLLRRIGLEP